MSRQRYDRYVDGEGVIHAVGTEIAVNAGLCGDNDNVHDTDDPVTCRVCIAVDKHVRARAALRPEGVR